MTGFDSLIYRQTTCEQRQSAMQASKVRRARFTIYRDACADTGVAWARLSQREQRRCE